MPGLPVISGRRAVRVFASFGWEFRRRRGSHMILAKPGVPSVLSVPDHPELGRGLLRDLVRRAGLTVDEFVEALDRL